MGKKGLPLGGKAKQASRHSAVDVLDHVDRQSRGNAREYFDEPGRTSSGICAISMTTLQVTARSWRASV
jgi:hypothetical protein